MRSRTETQRSLGQFRLRVRFALVVFTLAAVGLIARAVDLQLLDQGFLAGQGDARHLRIAPVSAHRGMITDRRGEPLAVSSPVDSVWANPSELASAVDRLPELATALERDGQALLRKLTSNMNRGFVYLRRHMNPSAASKVAALNLPGVYLLREYRRYYPAGEVAGHVVGFTNIDDEGLEGLELAFDYWLAGEAGRKRVMQDRLGRVVGDVESIQPAKAGKTLVTSLDLRIQYIAYRALKAAIRQHNARSGSVVVVDVQTGEVLAMANQPGYNPNDRSQYSAARYRNRAVTDIFEPGSSFKTLVMAAAIESGAYHADTPVDTGPGSVTIGPKRIEDTRNLGLIDATEVLKRSSNVGITQIAMSLEPEYLWSVLSRLGFGRLTSSGFPGESAGLLVDHSHWRPIGQATLSYGYGLSVTPLQLAQGYATLGAGGIRPNLSFLRQDTVVPGERVLRQSTANEIVGMLETVVGPEGTGIRAAVNGYRIAGKTGTARKFEAGGYSEERYVAVFAGLAPASAPRLAVVAVVDEPSAGKYHGGDVAAPLFSVVAAGALRLLAVAPDDLTVGDAPTIVQARAEPDGQDRAPEAVE